MNRLLNELHGLITRKIGLYDKFIALLHEQWRSITEYSLESLQGILEKKEQLVIEMQKLEQDRSRVMQSIEAQMGHPEGGLTLKKIIQSLDDPAMKGKLSESRERLLAQISEINEVHENLKNLMDHSALSMKKSMAFIHSVSEAAESPYRSNGKLQQGELQGRMLSLDA